MLGRGRDRARSEGEERKDKRTGTDAAVPSGYRVFLFAPPVFWSYCAVPIHTVTPSPVRVLVSRSMPARIGLRYSMYAGSRRRPAHPVVMRLTFTSWSFTGSSTGGVKWTDKRRSGIVNEPVLNDRQDPLTFMATRRSCPVANMAIPGPDDEALQHLLTIAGRVPDHGKLTPWRFIVFRGRAREMIGECLAARSRALQPHMSEETHAFERGRFCRAPVVVCVVSTAEPHPKIPEWEQILSAGAVCHTLLTAAIAMGYAAQWITEWYAYDEVIRAELGLYDHERVAGFVHIGTATAPLYERQRPDISRLVTWFAEQASGESATEGTPADVL